MPKKMILALGLLVTPVIAGSGLSALVANSLPLGTSSSVSGVYLTVNVPSAGVLGRASYHYDYGVPQSQFPSLEELPQVLPSSCSSSRIASQNIPLLNRNPFGYSLKITMHYEVCKNN